jgi:hypothetical protein
VLLAVSGWSISASLDAAAGAAANAASVPGELPGSNWLMLLPTRSQLHEISW